MWEIETGSPADIELMRKIKMMYMTLTLMAGLIAVMFVATAVSSIINSIRENEAAREAQARRIAF
jgi:hypothetical protein